MIHLIVIEGLVIRKHYFLVLQGDSTQLALWKQTRQGLLVQLFLDFQQIMSTL